MGKISTLSSFIRPTQLVCILFFLLFYDSYCTKCIFFGVKLSGTVACFVNIDLCTKLLGDLTDY